jgi:hypothetical protein
MRGHVVALLVQYQRYREWAISAVRSWSCAKLRPTRMRRLLHGPKQGDMLLEEVAGFLGGFAYFARHHRWAVYPTDPAPLRTSTSVPRPVRSEAS